MGYGAGITVEYDVIINNSQFINNIAKFAGSVYFKDKGSVFNSNFIDNTATDYGGALYFTNFGVVDKSVFINNSAVWAGAILFSSSGIVNNSFFNSNNAGTDGGALYFEGNGIIDNSLFADDCGETGGSIFSKATSINIINSRFHNNVSNKNQIHIISDNLKLDNVTFICDGFVYGKIDIISKNISFSNISFINNISNEILLLDNNHDNVSIKLPVFKSSVTKSIINKKTVFINAKSLTFKKSVNIKKVSVQLKTQKAVLKNKKITVKISGKTYSSKSNSNGIATFNIKLNKKGKFKALIKFSGDDYYNSCKKTISFLIK